MFMIWKILVLCMIVELISSQQEPETVDSSHDTHDVSIQTDYDSSLNDPVAILQESINELKLLRKDLSDLINKLDYESPSSSSASKHIPNGFFTNLCIMTYIIVTLIFISSKH
ncbi:unnamed protein product [Schistosoma rodhaini]|uniref:Hypotheticial protein n=1 Tax=Schistosoma mansoni TaxID=6183 RepID=A0A5K4F7B5_SCHMA|nr:unnamed protein product [Schistosoma rodhaini]